MQAIQPAELLSSDSHVVSSFTAASCNKKIGVWESWGNGTNSYLNSCQLGFRVGRQVVNAGFIVSYVSRLQTGVPCRVHCRCLIPPPPLPLAIALSSNAGRWVNLRCCPNIQGAGTSQNVVDLRSRLAARGPRYNRGAAFVMERPESQFHAISPDRATSPALSNIDRGDRGDADREDLSGSHRAHLQKRLNSTRYLSPQEAFRNSPGGDISGSDIRPPDTLTPRTDTGIAVDSSTLGSDVARPNTPKSDTTVTAAVEPRDHLAPASTAFSSIGKASGRQGAQQEQPGGGYCTTPSPPPAKKVPLLPSGVGDFSLGQRRWKQGTRSPDPAIGDAPSRAGMESSGRCATTTKEVPATSGAGAQGGRVQRKDGSIDSIFATSQQNDL